MKNFAALVLAMGFLATPAFAEELPCQNEKTQLDYYVHFMYTAGHPQDDYRTHGIEADRWEGRFNDCLDEYETKHGPEATDALFAKFTPLDKVINDARKGQ